jgi:hypothetical protein
LQRCRCSHCGQGLLRVCVHASILALQSI